MKKIILGVFLLVLAGATSFAQLNTGGIPLSFLSVQSEQAIPIHAYPLPDQSRLDGEEANLPGLYVVALFAATEVTFPESGVFSEAPDGSRIWRTQISIPGAEAIGLYYDQFQLPKGVNLYIYNGNRRQILGAFSVSNNAASGKFANEAVQGDLMQIELNIDASVNMDAIKLYIDRSAVYFRGVNHLIYYSDEWQTIDRLDSVLSGSSSRCAVDAACPLGDGYADQRDASVQELIPVGGFLSACSGTMINSTGNTEADCKAYLLTASHCDQSNSLSSTTFDQWLIRFNFMRPDCNGFGIPESNTLVGADLIARSDYTAPSATDIKGDFMLLELRDAIPEAWGVKLAGWNRDPNIPTGRDPDRRFIGFHHPSGDMKKVSVSERIRSTDVGAQNSHWGTTIAAGNGVVAGGTSGSALFDQDGYIIGIASIAGPQFLDASCFLTLAGDTVSSTADFIAYGKFDYSWDYSVDGNDDYRKLKPWLDPAETGVIQLNTVSFNCSDMGEGTGIRQAEDQLSENIHLFPNPVKDGKLNLQFNLAYQSDVEVSVYDISGKLVDSRHLSAVTQGSYGFKLNNLSPGMYLLKFRTDRAETSKKILVQ